MQVSSGVDAGSKAGRSRDEELQSRRVDVRHRPDGVVQESVTRRCWLMCSRCAPGG